MLETVPRKAPRRAGPRGKASVLCTPGHSLSGNGGEYVLSHRAETKRSDGCPDAFLYEVQPEPERSQFFLNRFRFSYRVT